MQLQTIGFVLLVVLQSASSDLEDSIGEFHFTISDVVGNFSDAMSWCKSNNSTLAVVKDNVTQKALARFLNSSHLTSMMYINFKLYQIDNNTWFLLNGSNYYGNIGNQIDRDSNYSLFSCLLYDVNASVIQASAPSDFRNYICDYNADRYPNNSANNIVYDGRCYVKYESESLTWYQARERCINNGGDLAQFQNGSVSNPWIVPFNTSWLDQSLTYWLGIRWNGWSWKSFDDSEEIIYTSFSVGKPSTFNYSCVCVDPRGNPAWSWTDCDCTEERPFVCLQIIPTTTTATTTSPIANPATATTAGLIVGVVLGLGVILPLAIITLVVIVWNVRLRRRLRDCTRNSEQVTTTTGSAQVDAAETDAQYQYLKRDTVFAPGTAVPHYDQLKNPEDPNYEMAITSSETIGD